MYGNVTVNEDVKGDSEMSTQMEVSDGSMGCDGEDSNGGKQSNVQEECRVEEENQKKSSMNSEEGVGLSGDQEVIESGEAVNSEFAKDSNEVPSRVNDVSYAKTVTKSLGTDGNKLYTIPTSVNNKGEEVVVFDEEPVLEGCEKWKFCGMLYNVPLEAWSIKGISTISSRVGRPIMMDQMTSDMCKEGSGRLGYARVLIEVDAEKEYLEKIEINYVDSMKRVKMTKWVKVEYSWKPDRCNHCKVFGHNVRHCKDQQKKGINEANKEASTDENKIDSEGFVEVKNRKKKQANAVGSNNGIQGNKQGYKRNVLNIQQRYVVKQKMHEPKSKERDKVMAQGNSSATVNKDKKEDNMTPPSLKKIWNVGSKNMEELRKSANKYAVLSKEGNDKDLEDNVCHDDRLIVDRYILMKSMPPPEEKMKWTYDMKLYFKYRWDRVNRDDENSEEEDIIEESNAANSLVADEIGGELRQNDAKKFIQEEKVNMCAFIETHLKTKNIMKVGNKVFGDCDWDSNVQQTPSLELIPNKIRFYCTIVYASNTGAERRGLWKELIMQKQFVKNEPWVILGDFNVTLNVAEHSSGSSEKTMDMAEFNDTINTLEVEDIYKLKSVHAQVDKDPHDEKLRKEAASTLNEFVEASKDEMKMLKQKAKIKWLNEEDKITAFFHGILKSRRSKSRVDFIKDEAGISYEGDIVNDQFVKHFEKFFGKVDHNSSIDESIFKKLLSNEEAKI
ncbi:RNA-directed DNA polymerase, eukaryota, reverse transcriptase zinc-binding domain protein [Tanacetum coccineum]